jgi:hypothetical protein
MTLMVRISSMSKTIAPSGLSPHNIGTMQSEHASVSRMVQESQLMVKCMPPP